MDSTFYSGLSKCNGWNQSIQSSPYFLTCEKYTFPNIVRISLCAGPIRTRRSHFSTGQVVHDSFFVFRIFFIVERHYSKLIKFRENFFQLFSDQRYLFPCLVRWLFFLTMYLSIFSKLTISSTTCLTAFLIYICNCKLFADRLVLLN